jgi:hypothetical protein
MPCNHVAGMLAGLRDLARNERAGGTTVQNDPGNEMGTEVLRLLKEPQCLARYPAVEGGGRAGTRARSAASVAQCSEVVDR